MSYPPQPPAPDDEPRYGVRLPEDQRPPLGPPAGASPYPTPPAPGAPNPYAAQQPFGQQSFGGQPQPYAGQQPFAGQPQPYTGGPTPYGPGGTSPRQRNALGIWSIALGGASVALCFLNWLIAPVAIGAIITGILGVGAARK